MENQMENTIVRIANRLNFTNVIWAIGGSVMLSYYDLVKKPNDIDIFVATNGVEEVDSILKTMGKRKKWEEDEVYSTKYFYEYCIDGTDVDVISGFQVKTDAGIFHHVFDEHSIGERKNVEGEFIPLSALEDWYVMYQLMPDRESKVNLIERHLIKHGIKNRFLLERALQGNIPEMVRKRTEELLRKQSISRIGF